MIMLPRYLANGWILGGSVVQWVLRTREHLLLGLTVGGGALQEWCYSTNRLRLHLLSARPPPPFRSVLQRSLPSC